MITVNEWLFFYQNNSKIYKILEVFKINVPKISSYDADHINSFLYFTRLMEFEIKLVSYNNLTTMAPDKF